MLDLDAVIIIYEATLRKGVLMHNRRILRLK